MNIVEKISGTRRGRGYVAVVSLSLVVLFTSGCGSLRPRKAVPKELVGQAQIEGFPNARLLVSPMQADLDLANRFLTNTVLPAKSERPLTLLVLSGGGADGAFGAGLLRGWTEAGDRPEFDVVTGISTGALIGPYAFLGKAWDEKLERDYTTISDQDIYETRSPFQILRVRDAVASSAPLQRMIERQIDEATFSAIAAEYRKGRRFYVGTTDLDAQSLMVWDMGAIANSGRPGSIKLFRQVLLASASIPVAFPPVYFHVEAGGKKFDEMHADGGCVAQAFGPMVLKQLMTLSSNEHGRVFMIRNAQLPPQPTSVKPKLAAIAGRAISTMIKVQGFGDVFRAYTTAQVYNLDFNLAAIPPDFALSRTSEFDKEFMSVLFATSREQARKGFPWAKSVDAYGSLGK